MESMAKADLSAASALDQAEQKDIEVFETGPKLRGSRQALTEA